jgi:photosystem II stability/assembly factor-like uncharacterized protein
MKKYILYLSILPWMQIQAQIKISSSALGKMEIRPIGPAVMGGRTTAIDGINKDPKTMYVGTAGGGVWKSNNGGAQFVSVFDKHCQSIGSIAIDQANPETVWVGTGESNMRNTVSIGNGIYKTTDGGENWIKMGLEKTEHISKIIIHPKNSDIVYVSSPGNLYNNSSERGLFKTADGGKTWNKIFFINDSTGAADIAMDPKNPDIIYCSMWQFRRKPFSFSSGGKGSGLFKSIDGGKNWKKIQNGFPSGDLGRIVITVAPSDGNRLCAIVEARDKAGLYISEDAGETWKAQSADDNVTARPFYFSTLVIDPIDAKRVYRPSYQFSISSDGGYSWSRAQSSSGWVHVDMHALWINPVNTSHMYVATDGGVYMSVDRGNNWIHLNNMPIAQFYHVAIDNKTPYNVYGGLQDNGSWMAPSQSEGGIENGDWKNVGGGDGFWVQPDPVDDHYVYSEYQGGHINRLNIKTNQSQDIQPQPLPGEKKLRFNWNTPIYRSPNNPKRMYTGAQFLYRTENKGITWERISPDLTTNDPAKQKQEESGGVTADNTSAENHCTIFTIAESPLDPNLLMVGTDDGNLQITVDGGKNWKNVSSYIKNCGIPSQTWVSSIALSRFDKNTLYATFDNHMYGDMNSYIALSKDLGNTWTRLNSPEFKGYAHKVLEDIDRKDILYLGTEMGFYFTLDGGINWTHMKGKLPAYALVRDIVQDKNSQDIILATHGRGIYIISDVSALKKISSTILNSDIAFIPSKPFAITTGHYGSSWPSAGGFVGGNSNEMATISYYMKDRLNSGAVKIEIFDTNNHLVTEFPGTKRKGINAVTWEMRSKPPKTAEGGSKADWASTVGPLVKTGKYKVVIKAGDKSTEGILELVEDTLNGFSKEESKLNQQFVDTAFAMEEELSIVMKKLMSYYTPYQQAKAQKQIIAKETEEMMAKLNAIRGTIVPVKEGNNAMFVDEENIREKITELYYGVSYYQGRPTDSQIQMIAYLRKEIESAKNSFTAWENKYGAKVNKAFQKSAGKAY